MDTTEAKIRAEYTELATRMTDARLFGTPEMVKIAKRQAELTPLVQLYDRRLKLEDNLANNRELLNDPELADLAREEIPELEAGLMQVADQLRLALVPKDTRDAKTAIIEI